MYEHKSLPMKFAKTLGAFSEAFLRMPVPPFFTAGGSDDVRDLTGQKGTDSSEVEFSGDTRNIELGSLSFLKQLLW